MKTITIVGGGLGGLTAGALLAKAGHKVTLLEQHTIVGGCATTFHRKGGFTCEVGLHKMDGVYTNPMIQKIFKELGVYDAMDFVASEHFLTMYTRHRSYTLPYGIDAARDYLVGLFPDEKSGLRRYFDLIRRIGDEIQALGSLPWYLYPFVPLRFWRTLRYMRSSVTDVLDRLIRDEELKLILNANVQYYNDHPDTLSFLMHAVAQSSYYIGKGWFIRGGSSTLSNHLARVITDHGGEVLTGALVTACSPDSVTYVLQKKTHTLPADLIVSNASPQDTYRLFGHLYQETREISDGLVTVYLGFRKNLKEVYGTRDYANFLMDDIASLDEYKAELSHDILDRSCGFTDYSQIDAALTKDPAKSYAVACATDYIEEWEHLSPEEYQTKKLDLIARTLSRLERRYPGITDLVEYAEVGTAKTQQRYLRTPKGTAYGFKPTPKQFFHPFRSRSPEIDNLYFVGQWVISGGFSSAIMSGGVCAREIAGRR